MKVLVITPEESVDQEVETCNLLLSCGLERLHVRKPNWTKDRLRNYLTQINTEFRSQISVHEHHELASELSLGGVHFKGNDQILKSEKLTSKSCHSFNELMDIDGNVDYAFISPIFDSISKTGYRGKYSIKELKGIMTSMNYTAVYGLGGIDTTNVSTIDKTGLNGIAVLGAIWQNVDINSRVEKYHLLINTMAKKNK
ncbi:thiamine phosphate synthase [Reichenbachiella versicolor]|uniref:thiamine phosphate synthase n=1 Tax=Reichenbachiella versicolor TaxID=1821036 RepID=UPI000D6E1536|nr:thiamine phosphate synthase [Reichenbachiella versicolor]